MKAAHSEVEAAQPVNPGETLRQAREARGWEIAEVASQLNLTSQRLVQIEDGAFDKLPGHTFARGYIRAYAKLLGMDQARLVLEFDQFTGSNAVGSNVQSLGRIEEPVRYSQRILRFVSFALLLALAGIGFYWWQERAERFAEESAAIGIEHVEVEGADGTTQIHPLDEPEDQAVLAAQDSTELELSTTTEEPEIVAESEPAEEPAQTAVAEQPVAAAEPAPDQIESEAPAPAVQQVAAGEGVVQLSFSADCWTQLTDASGKVLYSGLKRAGESLELTGKAPMELRLGFARGAQVRYNGEPVDVSPFTTGETARLKLGSQ
ncbi:RodZ domain-containing protein [Pseudomonas zhanjiangensis]|uniref:RodZ domain-containing protein n=1 Tax=Pseudomonas zhanjiangensis TaxID=3239015 RepID=A0ABV3YPL2_9PSED